MADEEKGAKPTTPSSVEHPAEPAIHPAGRAPSEGSATEWTASDRRGPLTSAGDEEVERVVPAHEMDAEGVLDPAARETPLGETLARAVHEGPEHADPHPHEPAGDDPLVSADGSPAATASPSRSGSSARTALPSYAEPERKRSLVPVAAGLVVGALIGAGSAYLVYSQSAGGAGDPSQVAALASRVAALEKRPDPQPELGELKTGLGDVRGKVAMLDKRLSGGGTEAGAAQPPAPQAPAAGPAMASKTTPDEPPKTKEAGAAPSQSASSAPGPSHSAAAEPKPTSPASAGVPASADAGLAAKVAALQTALDDVKTRTAALQAQDAKASGAADKVASLQSGIAEAQKQAADAQSALDTVKSEQKALGDKLAGLTVAVAGALSRADGAEKQAAGLKTGVDTVQSQQKVLEGKLGSPALAVVADSLVQQIDAGQPFTRQVEALAALNADPAKIAVLRENAAHGVPSSQVLLAKWKPLADPVIATGNKAPANANFGEKLEHGLFGLVTIRRADEATGNDLASRVAQIESALAHDDVAGAYATWQALPPDAKAKSDSWGALAKTSVEALTAARDLQHNAIDALGAKKS